MLDQPPVMNPTDSPTLQASEDAEFLENYVKIKELHQLVPSCRRAIFDEEALNMSLKLRILTYADGSNWFIGKREDHGPPMAGETRSKAQRVRGILKAKRQDLMRLLGLMDRGDLETVALTFHGHLFDQGAMHTDSGGIPGCPGPLTNLQRQACRASSEANTDYMVELYRRKMLHNGGTASDDSRPVEKYTDKALLLAAAELSRCCDGTVLPRYAIAHYNDLFADDADVAPRPRGIILNDTVAEPVIPNPTVMVQAIPIESALLPNAKRVPGDVCIKARTYLRGRSAATLDCPDDTCVLGSEFLKTLRPGDNIRPETLAYPRYTFKDAGSKSNMRTGVCDLRYAGSKKFWHLDGSIKWPVIKADMDTYGFVPSIRGYGYLTVGVENYIRGDNDPGADYPNGSKPKPFSVVTLGSPGGGVLAIHCQFNGHGYDGHLIPEEMLELLADPEICCLQFGIREILAKLTAGGVSVTSWVEAQNVAMIAYPQPGVPAKAMKSGRPFVTDMLDTPTKIYSVQGRDREVRKARGKTSRNPLSDSLPPDVPNIREHRSTFPLYSEAARRRRTDYWDLTEDNMDVPIDFDADDFTKIGKWWNTRMILYIAHQHGLPLALNGRMAYRAAIIHGISLEADANRYIQYVLGSLREVEAFANGPRPSERALRPLGEHEWMDSEASRPDTPYRARPYYASGGFSGKTSTKCIAEHMDKSKRHFAVDPMGLTRGFREDLENLNGGRLDRVDLEKRILIKFQRQVVRPHRCSRCGSGNHTRWICPEPDSVIKCIYPRCRSDDHVIAVCPVVIKRCTGCEKLGHGPEDHPRILWPILQNDYMAASCFHDLGIFTCERLSVSMGTDAGEFIVIPEVDYSDDRFVSKQDRHKLSALPLDVPY